MGFEACESIFKRLIIAFYYNFYKCSFLELINKEGAWVLSRQPTQDMSEFFGKSNFDLENSFCAALCNVQAMKM